MLSDPQPSAIERAGYGPRRGDVMVVDAFEPDRAKTQFHHRVHCRHAEKKTRARLEYAHNFAQSLFILMQMLEHREAECEVELRVFVGQIIDTALDKPGGAPMAPEPRL